MRNPPDERMTSSEEQVQELFLLRLRHKEGQLVKVGHDKPILLDDPGKVWVVYRGRVDVFAVRVENGQAAGARHHLLRVPAGQAVLGMSFDGDGEQWGLIAVGDANTELVRIPRQRMIQLVQKGEQVNEVVRMIDRWITELGIGIAREFAPRTSRLLEAAQPVTVHDGETTRPARGVLWVRLDSGNTRFMGRPEIGIGPTSLVPLSPDTWLEATDEANLCGNDTRTVLQQEEGWGALDTLHRILRRCLALNALHDRTVERELLNSRVQSDQERVGQSLSIVAAIMDPRYAQLGQHSNRRDALYLACEIVAHEMGITLRPPPHRIGESLPQDPLGEIARSSRFRTRRVFLRQGWWREDNGPLLAFKEKEHMPVALVRTSKGYDQVDPVSASRTPVTASLVKTYSPNAVMFYRPFPDRALNAWDLVRFGGFGSRSDLILIALLGAAGGLLSLATPLATGVIFDSLIPGGARNSLVLFGLVLVVMAISAALFRVTQSVALLRFSTRMDVAIQPAIWDRLLELPVPFFRNYSAGDLAQRSMGITTIRQILTDTVVAALLSAIFSVFNLALLFYYDFVLGLVALVLILIGTAISITAGMSYLRLQRERVHATGRVAGIVLELLTGISKFRVAGAEERAFATWAEEYGKEQTLAAKMTDLDVLMAIYYGGYPVVTMLVIFAVVILSGQGHLSTGAFLAFNAAFTQFLIAMLSTSATFLAVLNIVPLYERALPILKAQPESAETRQDPGELSGEIEISHVSFRYQAHGPLILDDVSLNFKPREFIAIVGASGSGKSTLMRLLLGFETPEAGTIMYDGKILSGLDLRAVRQQLGVVLQNSKLISGSLFQNIVGAFPLTLDDAWQAARKVGLDEDIKQMPMGMHTFLIGEGNTLSGGQRQRVLLARAVVNKPRILLLDEATSALDNQSQALVAENLARLQATRIVIAHRLSTIVNADRIYVMDRGKIVQSGSYEELIKQKGPFAELAKRQLA